MNRRVIIFICILNTLLASSLALYVLKTNTRNEQPIQTTGNTTAQLSDKELWESALSARHLREANSYLERYQDRELLLKESREYTQKLLEGDTVSYELLTSHTAVLQQFAKLQTDASELKLLSEIAKSKELPLTIRDTAFKAYITSCIRFNNEAYIPNQALELIDYLITENNSLQMTALQAEKYLLDNQLVSENRLALFKNRLVKMLKDSTQLEITRIAALQIGASINALTELSMDTLYGDSTLNLQTEILKALTTHQINTKKIKWLVNIIPLTQQQEQLIQEILHKAVKIDD